MKDLRTEISIETSEAIKEKTEVFFSNTKRNYEGACPQTNDIVVLDEIKTKVISTTQRTEDFTGSHIWSCTTEDEREMLTVTSKENFESDKAAHEIECEILSI